MKTLDELDRLHAAATAGEWEVSDRVDFWSVRTWAGSAAEEGGAFTATTVASTTVVGLAGDPTPPTETGCGA